MHFLAPTQSNLMYLSLSSIIFCLLILNYSALFIFHCPAFKITIRDCAFFNKAKKSINFSFVHVSILWPVLSTCIVGEDGLGYQDIYAL